KAHSQLRLLTWDVKDTLLRLRVPVGESYSAEARACGVQVQAEALTQSFRQAYRAQSLHFPNYGSDRGLSSKQWWMDVVMETFRLSGIHGKEVVRPILLPGARDTLKQCQRMGVPMAVISNFDQRLQEVLTRCGLRQHFDFVLTSEEVGFAKPDKRIFLEALRIAGVSPQLAAHVGDDYVNDYKAAREAGMHSFLYKSGCQPLEKDAEVPNAHILPSLMHLPSLIEKG
uniref:Haloacid dehalogenase-like hydrolase domain-containing protein 3 n=1 Tax=Podarcis muralis TaxID=64176 RepID=A0A670JEI0_PODMU